MLIYSVLIILHYYFITIFYYDNIILSYYYIILAQYTIYWHFSNQGFCSRMAPYQWFWIIEDCFRHRISARIFSMLEKTITFKMSFVSFWAQAPLGPGPWSPLALGPMGPPFFEICWLFAKWSGTYLKVFLWCSGASGPWSPLGPMEPAFLLDVLVFCKTVQGLI